MSEKTVKAEEMVLNQANSAARKAYSASVDPEQIAFESKKASAWTKYQAAINQPGITETEIRRAQDLREAEIEAALVEFEAAGASARKTQDEAGRKARAAFDSSSERS